MKALGWVRLFHEYAEKHDKRVFTFTELAHVSRHEPEVLRVILHRLQARGVVSRLAHGLYGGAMIPVTVAELVSFMDATAYITGWRALYEHGRVTQPPKTVTCFTSRRHYGTRQRTALGVFEMMKVAAPIYEYPAEGRFAVAEQALADFVYLCLRRGLRPEGLVTFYALDQLQPSVLKILAGRYPGTVQKALSRLVPAIAEAIRAKRRSSRRAAV